jgi:hypothetical protein
MKWCPPGAQAVLDLRSVRVNGDWDAYQCYHRHCAHARRYASPLTLPHAPETEMLVRAA